VITDPKGQEPELRERTVPGLHAALIEMVRSRVPRSARVLDCAAGTGAWLERLRRAGYEASWGIDQDQRQYAGISPFVRADLDGNFAQAIREGFGTGQYDLITAIEIIEHLENPSHFLRECRRLIDGNGLLLLTSPNLDSPPARLKIFAAGELRHFDRSGDPTHITPIFSMLFPRLADRAGFLVEAVLPAPDAHRYHGTRAWRSMLAKLLCSCSQNIRGGDVNVFLLRPKPDSALTGPETAR